MIETKDILLRLFLGALLGGIIGFERQAHGRAAGFRTHLLVSVAAVLVMLISLKFYTLMERAPFFIRVDPLRIAAGAITGVGFLGAGVIIKAGFTIQGLTTAACIWTVFAIGLAIGAGQFTESAVASFITLMTLWGLRKIEDRIPRLRFKSLSITTEMESSVDIVSILKEAGLKVYDVHLDIDKKSGLRHILLTFTYRDSEAMKKVINKLESDRAVLRIQLKG